MLSPNTSNAKFSETTMFNRRGSKMSPTLMNKTSYGLSNMSLNSKLTRKDRNQKKIDSIKHVSLQVQSELQQLQKDIYDNVLEYHVSPGALNQKTIDFALKTSMWDKRNSEMGQSKFLKTKGPPLKATKEQIMKAEVGYENIAVKCKQLTEFGRIDRTTVREQSARINELLVIKKRRY